MRQGAIIRLLPKTMQIDFKGTNYEPTDEVLTLARRKVANLEKFLGDDTATARAYVDLGRETEGKQNGNVWYTDIIVETAGDRFYAKETKDSIEKALDAAVGDVAKRLRRSRKRKQTLFKRGGVLIKSLMQRDR